jgi:hypothetical protein
MADPAWRPRSEAEAVGAQAVFLEWLAAVHGIVLAGPAALAGWRRDAPAAFAAAISAFAGLDMQAPVRETLLRGHAGRPALVLIGDDGKPDTWSRAEALGGKALPDVVANMLAALAPADLPALAASHLLDAGTAPDDCLVWAGDPAEPWPLGAWLVGASVMLGSSDAAAVRAAPPWRA